jgi:hypothetical protein
MNAKRKLLCWALCSVVVAAAVPFAVAQPFTIDWHSIDGGGEMRSDDGQPNGFELSGTIGQPDAASNPTLSNGTFELTGGFWPVTQVCFCPGDMNGDGQKDGGDIQQFVACILTAGNCSCADLDLANGVTPDDTEIFVSGLLEGSACP